MNGTVFFFSPKGVFSTNGGAPVQVSNPIMDIIQAIPAANYPTMCSAGDSNTYRLFCGNMTARGRTYANLCLIYDVNTTTWGMTEHADTFTAAALILASDFSQTVIGGTSGMVMNFDTSTTDNGKGIKFERTVRTFLNALSETKVINDVTLYMAGAASAVFSAKTQEGKKYIFGNTSSPVTFLKGKELMFKGYVDLTISGINSQAPATFNGFEIVRARTLGNIS